MSSSTLPSTWAKMKRDAWLKAERKKLKFLKVRFIKYFISNYTGFRQGYLVLEGVVANAIVTDEGRLGFYDIWMNFVEVRLGEDVEVYRE